MTAVPIPEAARRLRDGTLTARALAEAALDAARDDPFDAFVALCPDRALAAADRADADLARGVDRGPMQGIPFGVKDLLDVAGLPTTCGSRRRTDHVALTDAEVVRRLIAAGAVPIGKLQTYEFALVGPSFDQPRPPARNPWDAERITGGSSSGSAAAVAGGLIRLAIGTDTGGSVRSPAAYCGAVGLKPTRDALPRDGVFPLSDSLDHVGLIAATADEAEIAFRVLAGLPPDLPAAGIDGLRIGYARDWFAHDPECAPGILSAMDDAVSTLSLLGARIELVALPDYDLMEAAGAVLLHAEALALHAADMAGGAGYGRPAYQSLAAGVLLDEDDVAVARAAGRRMTEEMDAILGDLDAVVTATTLSPAPPVAPFRAGAPVWTPMRTIPFDVTGHPALSVPAGFVGGLPVGMQVIGAAGAETAILRVARAFEAATDHAAAPVPGSSRQR